MAPYAMQVYNVAYTTCSLKGGDADFDGGCAVATSFGTAFAAACGKATAAALVDIPKEACDCNITVTADAMAAEYRRIFAHVEQQVESVACTDAGYDQENSIGRKCIVNSVAKLSAQVRAIRHRASAAASLLSCLCSHVADCGGGMHTLACCCAGPAAQVRLLCMLLRKQGTAHSA